jgi:hypothetical protein|tara:strand:- start:3054 stop:3389 length:336 start_codon:yes stop_codon:yes gene_type:complete
MALVDLVKGKDTPTPNKGATGNIPTDSPAGAGENFVPYSSRIIDGAKDVNPLGSPIGRHLNGGRDVLPTGSPIGRHIDSGNTILPQGSPRGRHTQSPLGVGTIRKSPLAGE